VDIKDASIWITGATGGFGRELAIRCAKSGARLSLSARSVDKLEALAGECTASGSPDVEILPLDVRDANAVQAASKKIATRFQRIDGFVASAADVPLGDLESLTNDDWLYGIDNKLLGTINCLRAVLPAMREQKAGKVVVLSGIRGTEPLPKSLLPGAVNAALDNIVKALSRDFARFGVAINAVSPSIVMTARGELYMRTEAEKSGRAVSDVLREWTSALPAGRFVTSQAVVSVIYDLLTTLPEDLTGQTLVVDAAESRAAR